MKRSMTPKPNFYVQEYVCIPMAMEQSSNSVVSEKKLYEQNVPVTTHVQRELGGTSYHHSGRNLVKNGQDSGSSRKPKVRKKESEDVSMPPRPDPIEIQNIPVDASYPTKCNEAALRYLSFYGNILLRLIAVKARDASEMKMLIENLVTDFATTLNLLNILHHLIFLRFYLCLWYKDDPKSQEKFIYYLAMLKSKALIRDIGSVSSLITRNSAKKISLALGQDNSFSRGFDKILFVLLASLRENSPILRAKALRAGDSKGSVKGGHGRKKSSLARVQWVKVP
ncbi:hypothetical protein IFM89_038822, partial [Coptis chinensis]